MDGPKKYKRCPCSHCGEVVEYPAYAVGCMTMCPHCGKSTRAEDVGEAVAPAPTIQKTASVAPAQSPPRAPRPATVPAKSPAVATAQRARKSRAPAFALAACCAAGVAAFLFYNHRGPFQLQAATQLAVASPTNTTPDTSVVSTDPPAQTNPPEPIIAAVKPAKSTNDFKISPLEVQRPKGAKGSKITYVMGVVTNLSDVQRFGVKIELELLDQRGTKIDSTSDYCDTLGSRQTWAFRAQAHDPRAVQARVADIKEDN